MSGRVRVTLEDDRTVTGFRKTLRRNPRRTPLERLVDQHAAATKKFPSLWRVRIGFWLPDTIAPFVADGEQSSNVYALKGFVQICHGSAAECFVQAEHFFAGVAQGKPWFSTLAAVTSRDEPRVYFRDLTVVNGAMVVTVPTAVHPQVYVE